MFKVASKKAQARAERFLLSRLPSFPGEDLSDEEYLETIRNRITKMNQAVVKYPRGSRERNEILNALKPLQDWIASTNKSNNKRKVRSFHKVFMTTAKDHLPSELYDFVYAETQKRFMALDYE